MKLMGQTRNDAGKQAHFTRWLRRVSRLLPLLLLAFTTLEIQPAWNHDGDFSLPVAQSIGADVRDDCVSLAPWGAASWGLEAASFNSETNALTGARFAQFGDALYLYGKQEAVPGDFGLGLVRAIQGNVWQDRTLCGEPIPWHIPEPLTLTGNPRIVLDYQLDTANLLTDDASWLMIAVNVWVSSPHFPPGEDGQGRKPLVLDLVLYHTCNAPSCRLEHFEDAPAFHYQKLVTDNHLRPGAPLEWRAALMPYIDDALRSEYLCREGTCSGIPAEVLANRAALRLHQLEFVIEMRNAEGAALLDHFQLLVPSSETQTEGEPS